MFVNWYLIQRDIGIKCLWAVFFVSIFCLDVLPLGNIVAAGLLFFDHTAGQDSSPSIRVRAFSNSSGVFTLMNDSNSGSTSRKLSAGTDIHLTP